jgi:hypothetical protein
LLQGILRIVAQAAPMEECRIAPRQRILKAGTISFGGAAIDCTVRNISDTGAALDVVTPLFIPDRFILFIQTAQFKRSCYIVWRRERRMGVAFD